MYHRRKNADFISIFSEMLMVIFGHISAMLTTNTSLYENQWANFLAASVAAGHRTKTWTTQLGWHVHGNFTKVVLDLEWPCNYSPNQSGTSRISGINGQFDRQLTEAAVYGGRKEMLPYGICMQYKTICHDFVQNFIRSMPQKITTCIQNINWGKRVYWMFCQLLPKVCICRLTFFSLYSVLYFFVWRWNDRL